MVGTIFPGAGIFVLVPEPALKSITWLSRDGWPHLRLEGEPADPNPAPVTPAQTGIAGGAEVTIALISPPHISAVWKPAPSGLGHL